MTRGVGSTGRWPLVAAVCAALAGLAYPAVPPPVTPDATADPAALTDARMFARVVDKVRSGEPYYSAMGAELRSNGYPAQSAFNWRTPLHLTMLAHAPWPLWRAFLTILLVTFYVAMMVAVRGTTAAIPANVLAVGVLVICAAQDAIYVPEAWAGALLGLATCAFALGWPKTGAGVALSALFVRELAAPFCVVATALAVWGRRWREVAVWGCGAVLYAIYYARHVIQVDAHRLPSDIAHGASWLTMPGIPFLQSTLTKFGWFVFLPPAASTVALALLAAGLVAAGTPGHARFGSAAYATFFLLAGFPFNDYWGFIAAPIWAISIAFGAGAIAEAIIRLRKSTGRAFQTRG